MIKYTKTSLFYAVCVRARARSDPSQRSARPQLTCVMQEEDERDDPGQNHVSGSHHEARTEHIFEHVPALAACQRLHPRPAAHARSRAHTPRAAGMVTERTLLFGGCDD